MGKKKNLIVLLASLTCSIFILACEVDISIKEMAAAKNGIEDAKKYDAEKHAPDEIKKAEALLVQSNSDLVDGKGEEARKSANDALLAANNAKSKSLGPYADSKIKQSDQMGVLAEKAYAERFSSNNFTQGKKLNTEAKSQYQQGDYVKSAETAAQSTDFFTKAFDDSVKNSSSLSNEISATEKRLADIRKEKNSNVAGSNLSRAEGSIRNAKTTFADKNFKASWQEIDSAKKELDTASLTINKQRISSSIAAIRSDIKAIPADNLPQDIKRDLDSATTELNGAELSLGQNNIRDADARVIRAEGLVNGAKVKINNVKKNEADVAFNNVESKLAQARSEDVDNKYANDLNKAENLIKNGKALAAAGKFNEAMNNAKEADRIISDALIAMEIDARNRAVAEANQAADDSYTQADDDVAVVDDSEDDGSISDDSGKAAKGRTYVVQRRDKNTDTLWRISKMFYNDSSYWPTIYIANKDQIKNPDFIFPGQKLVIPPKPKKRPTYKR